MMIKIKSNLMLLVGVCLAVSCGREQFLPDLEQEITEVQEETKLTTETDFAPAEDDTEGREKCSDSCNTKPGDIDKFRGALSKFAYECTGSSQVNDAASYCRSGTFNTCGSWMVLQSSGNKDHRSELKYAGNLDFNDKHIMKLEMVIENAPSEDRGGVGSDRGLTVAQIHNRSQYPSSTRPLLRIDVADGCVRAVVADSPKMGVSGNDTRCILDFSDGNRLYIELRIEGDGERIYYYVKNISKNKSASSYVNPKSDWDKSSVDSKYYFKTGAYAQVKTASGKPVPRVSYQTLKLDLNSSSSSSNSSGGNTVILRKRNAMSYALDGGNGARNNQNVKIWSYSSSNINQQWKEISRGNGYYSYQKKDTNYCIDGNSGGANGKNVKLYTCSSSNQNQQFKKVSMGNGYYRLQKRNASGYSIDGKNGGSNNQNVHMWSNNNNNHNQHWYFEYK